MLRNIILKVTRTQCYTAFSCQSSKQPDDIHVTSFCFTDEKTEELRFWMICPMTQNKLLENWQLNPAWLQSQHAFSCFILLSITENKSLGLSWLSHIPIRFLKSGNSSVWNYPIGFQFCWKRKRMLKIPSCSL